MVSQPISLTGGKPLVTESLEQWLSMWKVFVADRGAVDLSEGDGLAMRYADGLFPYWNFVFLTDADIATGRLRDRLGRAVSYLRGKRHPHLGSVVVCAGRLAEDARAGLDRAASEAGLTLGRTSIGMAGDFLPIPDPVHPALRLERARTQDQLQIFGEINCLARN